MPRLQRRGHSLNVAEVVGLRGIVVAGAERSPRLDHLRNTARVRYREPLAPVGDERLLFTTGATNRGTRLVNHVDQLVREAAAVLGSTAKETVTLALDKLEQAPFFFATPTSAALSPNG